MRARADLAKAAYGFTRNKREGDDIEAINRMFAPEFRNRLDSHHHLRHLSQEIIAKVVEKFVLQLEAQLADRDVTIELSDEASRWLIAHGYDELMGARPMARVIQEHIKKPLADEVLFGKLKDGGHVRVVVVKHEGGRDALGFEYLDGPMTPKPEKIPVPTKPKSGRRRNGSRRVAVATTGPRLRAESAAGKGLARASFAFPPFRGEADLRTSARVRVRRPPGVRAFGKFCLVFRHLLAAQVGYIRLVPLNSDPQGGPEAGREIVTAALV